MKELFKTNDKYLKTINTVVTVLCIVMAVLLFIFAVVAFIVIGVYGLIPLFCELFVAVIYLLWKVALSYLTDVKFIRNKIYILEELNCELIKYGKETTQDGSSDDNTLNRFAELQKLNEALKMGAITQEEFDEQKKKLI